jgi:integrase
MYPELQSILSEACYDMSGSTCQIVQDIFIGNIWRDFHVLRSRAGVAKYSKPFHSLRKSCAQDWAMHTPPHVLHEWMGHTKFETTMRYYLKVPESEYKRIAETYFFDKNVQKSVQITTGREVVD